MASTYVKLLVHLVFSTKHRANLIAPAVEPKLHAYLGGIASKHDCPAMCIGGTRDHVHLLVSMSKHITVIELLENLKKDSSKWMKTQGPMYSSFYWQQGYGAFSIGESGEVRLRAYIQNQKKHHRQMTFQEEFLALLKKYKVLYDERYVWD